MSNVDSEHDSTNSDAENLRVGRRGNTSAQSWENDAEYPRVQDVPVSSATSTVTLLSRQRPVDAAVVRIIGVFASSTVHASYERSKPPTMSPWSIFIQRSASRRKAGKSHGSTCRSSLPGRFAHWWDCASTKVLRILPDRSLIGKVARTTTWNPADRLNQWTVPSRRQLSRSARSRWSMEAKAQFSLRMVRPNSRRVKNRPGLDVA